MFLRRDARRRALDADRAATQAHLAADLLVDEGLATCERRHAELEAEALDAAEEFALTRRPNALGAVGVQTQIAAEAPVDEDEVRLVHDLHHCKAHARAARSTATKTESRENRFGGSHRPILAPASVLRAWWRPAALP